LECTTPFNCPCLFFPQPGKGTNTPPASENVPTGVPFILRAWIMAPSRAMPAARELRVNRLGTPALRVAAVELAIVTPIPGVIGVILLRVLSVFVGVSR